MQENKPKKKKREKLSPTQVVQNTNQQGGM